MTEVGQYFKISHLESFSFEQVLNMAEQLSGYTLKVNDKSADSICIQFKDIPGDVNAHISCYDNKNFLWLKSIPGEAPVLMDLLKLSMHKLGAESDFDVPDLKLPLTKQEIIEKNEKYVQELNKNLSQAMIGCATGIIIIIFLIVILIIFVYNLSK